LSRLFEGFGDDADATVFPALSHLDAETTDGLDVSALETSLLDDVHPADARRAAGADDTLGESAGDEDDGELRALAPDEYVIPDFERDAKDLIAYDDAKKRHIRQQISSAETAIQASFKAKREQLQLELKSARSFEDERRASAVHTTRQYANLYPNHVDKKGVKPPTFLENVFSFGRAGRLFRDAFAATEALEQLRAGMRKREEQLGTLEAQMNRAINLKEESIKKAMETDAGIAEFHDRPEISALFKRTERIRKERADYEKRLERGGVSDEEQRDRGMAEFKLTFIELPMMGAIIAKVARYGKLSYFQLRDLTKKEALVSYDSRLDPLRNSVFDVYSVAGAVAAKLKRNDNGTAFRVADHFKVCWRNQEEAEELYGQHRAALREERGLAKMEPRDENEAEIIERLASLASMVEGSGQERTSPAPSAITASPRL
jgi:hypothetical protein